MKKIFKITDDEIKRMYLDGNSLNDIAKVAQDTKGVMALRNKLHELGVNTKRDMRRYRYKISHSCKKYKLNSCIFNEIDTEEKAYWLGFLMADGYNHETKSCVALRLLDSDCEILEKFKMFLETDTPIYKIKRFTKNGLDRTYCELNICSSEFSKSLSKLGCVQGKTYTLEFPDIKESLYNHFIRGYFDGDGCVSISKRKDRKCMQYQLNFVGKKSVILKIQDIICINTNVKRTKLRAKGDSFANAISWCGKNVCKSILDYIYNNSTIYLKRKHDIYLKIGSSAE